MHRAWTQLHRTAHRLRHRTVQTRLANLTALAIQSAGVFRWTHPADRQGAARIGQALQLELELIALLSELDTPNL